MPGDLKIEVPAEATAEAVGFLKRVFGPAAEVGDALSDGIRFYRWKAAMRRIEAAAKLAKSAEISPKELPIKFLVPFLEKASLEDERSPVSKMWERLLANASDKFDWKLALFPDILAQIGPGDAKMLRDLVCSTLAVDEHKGIEVLNHDLSENEYYAQMVLSETLSNWSDIYSRHSDDHSLDSLLERLGPNFSGLNCKFKRLSVHLTQTDRTEDCHWYGGGHYDEMIGVAILQRQGLVVVKTKSETIGSQRTEVEWVEATSLGFDVVAACEFVPAMEVQISRTLREGGLASWT